MGLMPCMVINEVGAAQIQHSSTKLRRRMRWFSNVSSCLLLLPPHPLSLLSLKRQSKAIITTSTSAKPRLFWCSRDCGEPLLISLSLCRGTPIRPDSTLCNEGLGIKAAMERSAPLWSHCGWSPLFWETGTGAIKMFCFAAHWPCHRRRSGDWVVTHVPWCLRVTQVVYGYD